MLSLRHCLPIGLLLLLASGCGGPVVSPEQRAALETPARALEAQGAYADAASAWQRAAAGTGNADLANEYRLNAADALVRAGDSAGAERILSSLGTRLSGDLATRRSLVAADIALLNGDAARALAEVSPALDSTNPALLERYRRTRAEALLLAGDSLGSARELALLDVSVSSPQTSYATRQRIWERLMSVAPEQLTAQPFAPGDLFSGWLELASLASVHAVEPDALESAIGEWNLRYPAHPAGEQIVPELIERVRAEATPPSKVALLLPESGDFAGAGEAIRDGFMAAWFADAPNPNRPQVVVRDTGAGNAAEVYSRALAEGAQFVVGPLTRDAVAAVARDTGVPVTTIALNYPPPAAPDAEASSAAGTASAPTGDAEPTAESAQETSARIYFFTLSPEDEAARAAEFIRGRGGVNAGVLTPGGDWGTRVADAFERRFAELGGRVAVREQFADEPTSLSESVSRLLNIEASKERMKALRAVLARRMEFAPAPRSDLDALFLAAFPLEARQVLPLMQFHRAGGIPIVATSHIYTGTPSGGTDPDVEGVVFGDMPWLITPEIYGLPEQVQNALPESRGTLTRLYAFGADAYALVAQLPRLRAAGAQAYPGLSGLLSMGQGRSIKRDLEWARFEDGAPVSLSGNP